MENLNGAWINTGNSEFFVRNDDFFTNLKLAESFSADSIVAIDFVDKKTRKSIPYEFIKACGIEIKLNYNPTLDYLKEIDRLF